jgi:hypothetical protein
VAAQHGRKKAGQRFEKVVRERLRFWGNFRAEFLENEREGAARRGCPVPDQEAARSEPVERLTELLELIEDTRPYWTGPFVRARNRQVRADWHLSAIRLDSLIGPIWRAAGLKVSYGPNSIYAKFLAFAVERAEGRAGISAENMQAAFRRPKKATIRNRKITIRGLRRKILPNSAPLLREASRRDAPRSARTWNC